MTFLASFLVVLMSVLLAGLLLQVVTRIITLLIGTAVKIFGGKFNAKKFNSGLFRGIILLLTSAVLFTITFAAFLCFGPVALMAAGSIAVLVVLFSVLGHWFRWVWKQD